MELYRFIGLQVKKITQYYQESQRQTFFYHKHVLIFYRVNIKMLRVIHIRNLGLKLVYAIH